MLLAVSLAVGGLAVVGYAFRWHIRALLRRASPAQRASDGATRLAVLAMFEIVTTLALVELLGSLSFFGGGRVGPWLLPAGAVLSGCATGVAARHLLPRGRVLRSVAALSAGVAGVFVLCVLLAGSVYDASYDGNWYHQAAVVALAQGWNPVADPDGATLSSGDWKAFEEPDENIGILVIHYPKGGWVRHASVYALTGRLEQAKALNLLLVLASFIAAAGALLAMSPRRWQAALAAGGIAALNPIAVVQSFTFHNDGQMASLSTIAAALGLLALRERREWPIAVAGFGTLMLLAGLKLTGLAYAIIVAGALVLASGLLARRFGLGRRALVVGAAVTLLLGGAVAGFNPYVLNTVRYGSPFHPLMGPQAPDVEWVGAPENFRDKGPLTKLALSLFSEAADESVRGRGMTRLKVPFTVSAREIRPYLSFVTRIAGFGPLFGGAVLVGLVMAVLLARDPHICADTWLRALAVVTGLALVTTLANPESWWARYVPQLWLVPVMLAAYAVLRGRTRPQVWLGGALCFVLAVNLAFVGTINLANVLQADREMTAALREIAAWPGGAMLVQGDHGTTWVKLEELGVSWRLADEPPVGVAGVAIPYTTAKAYPTR